MTQPLQLSQFGHTPENKPALLFIHGWGSGHQVWLPLAAQLQADFRCYLLDLP
ncbi:MAG: cyclic nucleotide-binding protein, partial [Gammaproteobacteria bacterium]|nr:cyclic nucleotide-binding protein [Gammaproteobacteria bacterium]